ncbi:MAG: hypothetical protein ACP5NL_03570 [Thermoplasmata archaeon]
MEQEYIAPITKRRGRNKLGIAIASLIVIAIIITAVIVVGTFKSNDLIQGNQSPFISAQDLSKILGSKYNLENITNGTGERLMISISTLGQKAVLNNKMANFTNNSGGNAIIIVTVFISSSIAQNIYYDSQLLWLGGAPIQGSYRGYIYSLYYYNTFNISNTTAGWSSTIYNNNQTFVEIFINGNYTESQATSVIKDEINAVNSQ